MEESREALRLVVRCMDLTSLEERDTARKIAALCDRARHPDPADPTVLPVAAVCVYPRLVPVARERLAGTGIRVAAATGAFPEGRATLAERVAQIREALALGADEIDTVLDHVAFLAGRDTEVSAQIAASREACGRATLKVILETGVIGSPEAIRDAATLAAEAGADFLKSSTGKVEPGATPEATRAMTKAVRDHHDATGRRVGMKVAGGMRSARQALEYVAIVSDALGREWMTPELFRIGASSLLDDVIAKLHPA